MNEFKFERESAMQEDIDFGKAIDNDAIDNLTDTQVEDILSILTKAGY